MPPDCYQPFRRPDRGAVETRVCMRGEIVGMMSDQPAHSDYGNLQNGDIQETSRSTEYAG
jgi:hypothetical protein